MAGDLTVNFEAGIGGTTDHTQLSNIGINTHPEIDTHIANSDIHFVDVPIDGNQYVRKDKGWVIDASSSYWNRVGTTISPLNVGDNISTTGNIYATNTNAHIADTTIHFTKASIDHTTIQNIGTNSHSQIDTDLLRLANTSGTNTGDQTSIVGITGTKSQFNTALTDGNFLYDGDIDLTSYAKLDATNQPFTGSISATNLSGTNTGDITVTDSSEINFTLTGQDLTAVLIAGSIDETKLDASVNVSLDLADSSVQPSDLAPYELLANKDTTVTLGTSDIKYPSQNAVKEYVDNTIGSNAPTRSEWYQNGFKDVDGGSPDSDITITFDNASRTLSLTAKAPATSFTYYRLGYGYTETGTLTKQIADEDGLWVFYIGSSGFTATKNPSHDAVDQVIEKTCIVAYVMWDATNNIGKLMWEAHGMNMSPATHHWLHDNIGAVYREGMALSGMTVDSGGDLDSDVQFTISEGKFYDEDIKHIVDTIIPTNTYDIWYLDGSNWRQTNTNVPGKPISAGNRLAYNNTTLGTQVEITNNDFGLIHIFATNIMPNAGGDRTYIMIQGQEDYTTRRLARAGADVEINNLVYGSLPLEEVIPVATIILQTSNGHDNSIKSRIISTDSGDDFVDWRGSDLKATGGSISDHGSLAGLTDDDHQQYILADGTRAFTGVVEGITPTADNHLTTKEYVDDAVAVEDLWDRTTGKTFLKNTSDYLGIGTASPTKNLHVHSASGNASGFFSTPLEAGYANFKFDAGASGSSHWAMGTGGSDVVSSRANKFYISANNGSSNAVILDGTDFSMETFGYAKIGGALYLQADNRKLYLGAGNDASITYSGTDLEIRPREVGSGSTRLVSGDLQLSGAGAFLEFNGTHGGGNSGIVYEDTVGGDRYALRFDSNIVYLSNRASNGVVKILANTSTAGGGGETEVVEFQDDRILFRKAGKFQTDNRKLYFGAGDDTTIYFDGSNTRFDSLGSFKFNNRAFIEAVSGIPGTANALLNLRDTTSNIGFQMGANSSYGWIRAVDVGVSVNADLMLQPDGTKTLTGGNLEVGGGNIRSITTKTANYTILESDYTILADASSNTVTLTLPASPNTGQVFNIKAIDSTYLITVAGNGKNIDGSSSITITADDSITIQYDSAYGWAIV